MGYNAAQELYQRVTNKIETALKIIKILMEDDVVKYCFGVDIGEQALEVGLFNSDGVMLDKWVIATKKNRRRQGCFKGCESRFYRK